MNDFVQMMSQNFCIVVVVSHHHKLNIDFYFPTSQSYCFFFLYSPLQNDGRLSAIIFVKKDE